MLDLDTLNDFMGKKCVSSKADLSFSAFRLAFERWLPSGFKEQIMLSNLISLMKLQDRFEVIMQPGQKMWVLKCAIPEEQRDMVGS